MNQLADQINAVVKSLPPTVESSPEGIELHEQLHEASLDVLKALIEALNTETDSL